MYALGVLLFAITARSMPRGAGPFRLEEQQWAPLVDSPGIVSLVPERAAGASSTDAPGAVPAALHSLSTSALADVCAAHGLSVPTDSGKDEIVEMLEAHQVTPLDLT